MKRFILAGVVILCLSAPAGAACINTQAGDWDDCGERRRPGREPASWCGGGAGSEGTSWRQRVNIEEYLAKVKASLGQFIVLKPTYGD
jgi:hypothetical protein